MSDLPGAWECSGGNRSDKHYTTWFHNPELEIEMQVYWDEGEDHTVVVYDDERMEDSEDRKDPYPKSSRGHNSEAMAMLTAGIWMRELTGETRKDLPEEWGFEK